MSELWRTSAAAKRSISSRWGVEARVAGVLSSSSACVATLLGTWRAGGTFSSLPHPSRGMSPDAYVKQLALICDLVGAQVLLVEAAYRQFLPELPIETVTFEEVANGTPGRKMGDREGGALVQFTSGSTAQPKGVRLTLDAIAANVISILAWLQIERGDATCSWLPLSHDMGLIGMCLASVAAASPRMGLGDLVLIDPEHFLKRPAVWLRCCTDLGISITGAPNFGLEMALRSRGSDRPLNLAKLRILITGAERVRADTLRRFDAAFAPAGLRPTAICPAYGLAEATLAVTMVPPQRRWESRVLDRDALSHGTWRQADSPEGIELVSNGPTIPGVAIRCGPSTDTSIGTIEVAGPSLLQDYVGADLVLSEDGWFTTADLGYVADGELFVVARTDDVLTIAGRNYYASDLEFAVTNEVVRTGAVAAVATSDGRYALVAEPRDDASADQLNLACRAIRLDQLRRTGAAPTSVVFVPPRSLPKTPSGKLQRFKIPAALESGMLPVQARLDFEDASLTAPAGPAR